MKGLGSLTELENAYIRYHLYISQCSTNLFLVTLQNSGHDLMHDLGGMIVAWKL